MEGVIMEGPMYTYGSKGDHYQSHSTIDLQTCFVFSLECYFMLTPTHLSFTKGNKYRPSDKSTSQMKLVNLSVSNIASDTALEKEHENKDGVAGSGGEAADTEHSE